MKCERNTGKRFISGLVWLLIIAQHAAAQQYPVTITVIPVPPIPPLLNQTFSLGGNGIHVMIRNNNSIARDIKLSARLERKTPSSFAISTNKNYTPFPIRLAPNQSIPVNNSLLEQAFGNYSSRNLILENISLNDIKEGVNYKLPEGYYCIYFYARGGMPDSSLSDPNPVPVCFYICNRAAAPQFTQPVNNLNISGGISTLRPTSPVVFSWIPPLASCELQGGRITYDLEIREIFASQTVTDAINNPFVFRKTGLPSTTFLLDTNLNRNVLQQGRKYAIRVRASGSNIRQTLDIDNNGYSRVEAFQFGGNILPPSSINGPRYYVIPFNERKTDLWSNAYIAYSDRKRNDTLVPIKEYIAMALTQDGIAYNQDAIELFLALNPELSTVQEVKLSYKARHPLFPKVTEADRQKFQTEYATNLEPDPVEDNTFKRYLDSLRTIASHQDLPPGSAKIISDLVNHLNKFSPQVRTVNRITVNLVNSLLAELLYHLRDKEYSQLQGFFSALQELTSLSPNSTSFIHSLPSQKRSSLSSYHANTIDDNRGYFIPALMPQILPFDVIVWRHSREKPPGPVLDAPDLNAVFRVFYTVKKLYNHRNPEVNAKSTPRLASTAQVSLPPNSTFKFWTLNMLNHQLTEAVDVEPKDVFINSQKKGTDSKRGSIILKVD